MAAVAAVLHESRCPRSRHLHSAAECCPEHRHHHHHNHAMSDVEGGARHHNCGDAECAAGARHHCHHRRVAACNNCKGCKASCPLCLIMMSAVLLMSPLSSAAAVAVECGGHGALLSASATTCACEPGYAPSTSDALTCVPESGAPGSWAAKFAHGGESPEEHMWELMEMSAESSGHQTLSASDALHMLNKISGVFDDDHSEHAHDEHNGQHDHEDAECNGHGHLDGNGCHCDDGYIVDPSDSSKCLPVPSSNDLYEEHGLHNDEHGEDHNDEHDEDHDHEHAEDHDLEDHEYGGDHEQNEDHDYEVDAESAVCSGHGHLHDSECHCDEGWVMSSSDTTVCVPQASGRRMLSDHVCGGHGHVYGSGCHCDEGYVRDPSNSLNCLSSTSSTVMSDTLWTLTAADLIAVAGWNGLLHIENLTAALPLIVSCQMDSTCALEVSESDPHEGHDHGGDVELWMAVVATLLFFIVPVIAILTPYLVSRIVNGRTFSMFISLGNCFSAGLIFALGIIHIIPHSVEAQFEVGMEYPLSYLLITLGFFITLFAEQIPGIHVGGGPLAVLNGTPEQDLAKALPIKTVEGHDEPRASNSHAVETQPSTIHAIKDRGNTKQSSVMMMQRVNVLMPALVFFVASQFHACLEGLFVGITTEEYDFWIYLGGAVAHKYFLALSFGIKLVALWGISDIAQRWVLAIISFLWAALPALCVIIGYSISSSISGMTQLVLTSLSAGTFLYIGSFEILSEEFSHSHNGSSEAKCADRDVWGSKPVHSYFKFAAITVAVAVVALFALIPHTH